VAQRLIDGGASVVTVSRSRTEDTPKDSVFLSADLRTADSVNDVVQQAVQVLGGLDILVNNAGASRVRRHRHVRSPAAALRRGQGRQPAHGTLECVATRP
jgi:NAD(P)-dependent dehydrogenase (short-subunit alcohol dehydrogenase family)